MTTPRRTGQPALVTTLELPVRGSWLVRSSPARRVPSHGTHLFATTYAIDLVAVENGRTSATRDWRTVASTEPPERFVAFGRPVLAPVAGTVVALHDGEVDHPARRSPLTRLAYALTQARRARTGPAALAGNHLIIRCPNGTCVLLAHLRAGSIRVHEGQTITPGQVVATCGNSGNSTQPHVHLQAMDTADPTTALGLPMAFRRCRVRARGRGRPVVVHDAIPDNGDVVAP